MTRQDRAIRKILVLTLPGIGDMLLFTPALRVLRREFPDAEIVNLVMYRACYDAMARNPSVDRVILWEFFEKGFLRSLRFLMQLRKERFDVGLIAYPANRYHYNVVNFLAGARRRIAYRYRYHSWRNLFFLNHHTPMERYDVHNVEANLALLRFLGVADPREEDGLDFFLNEEDRSFGERFARTLEPDRIRVGMHAWSTELKESWRKCWDHRNFAELIDELHASGRYQVVLFEGPHDKKTNDKILALTRKPPVVVRETTLPQSAAILSHCDALVTNDSGVMHLAAAMRTPTVAIFGPTNVYRYRPYGVPHEVVWKALPCSPCVHFWGRPHSCQWGDFRCLDIGVSEVRGALERLLERPSAEVPGRAAVASRPG